MVTKPLSAFSYDWVSGDIWGLQALDDQCRQAASRIDDVDHALARQVSSVVSAGGWTGQAADTFTKAWDRDSKAGSQLAAAWRKIGEIAATLASDLAALESALEEAAYQLEKQGVFVDMATGLPSLDTTVGGRACPSPQVAAAHGKLASEYRRYRAGVLKQATAARTHATNALYTITSELLPPGTDWGQLANNLDGLRGLWAVPTEYRKEVEEALQGAEAEKGNAYAAMWDELLAKHKVSGYNARLEKSTVDRYGNATQAVEEQEGKLAGSPPESVLTKLADGDSSGLGLAGIAGGTLRAIPFVGSTAGAAIQIYQDRANHESWGHAIVDGVASNGAALGAGIVVAGAIGSGSVLAVGGGVVAGTAAAVGVGDFVHHMIQENWAADWHQHGVLDGTVHGVADSFDQTRHDVAHWLDDLNPF